MSEVLMVLQDPEFDEKAQEVSDRFEGLIDTLEALEITSDEDYELTLELLSDLKETLDDLEERLDEPREQAYSLYKQMLQRKKETMAPGQKAKEIAKNKLEEYRERKALEQEEKRRQIEEKASSDDPEEVEEALQEATDMDEEPTPDVEGVHYRENWSGELSDGDTALRELCHAIGKGEAPVSLVNFDESAANKLARRRKRELDKVPGVRSVRNEVLVDRR